MARMNTNQMELLCREEVYSIVGAAMEVHNKLGAGFAEKVYQQAMEIELKLRGVPFARQQPLRIFYKGVELDCTFKADLVCYGNVIVELKAFSDLCGTEQAQIINYLKATGLRVGVLINFGDANRLDWHRLVY